MYQAVCLLLVWLHSWQSPLAISHRFGSVSQILYALRVPYQASLSILFKGCALPSVSRALELCTFVNFGENNLIFSSSAILRWSKESKLVLKASKNYEICFGWSSIGPDWSSIGLRLLPIGPRLFADCHSKVLPNTIVKMWNDVLELQLCSVLC